MTLSPKVRDLLDGMEYVINGYSIAEVAGEFLLSDRLEAVEDEARRLLPEFGQTE